MAEASLQYPVNGPIMNGSVPTNKVPPGEFGLVVGADPRYMGSVKKFPGMALLDASGPAAESGYNVSFRKTGSSDVFRGFLYRDGATIKLRYWLDNGSTLTSQSTLTVYASGAAASTLFTCDTNDNFLYVAMAGQTPKVVWYNTSTPAVEAVNMGIGNFDPQSGSGGGEVTGQPHDLDSVSSSADNSGYYLSGGGRYMVRYRLYNSARGFFSPMSRATVIDMDHYEVTKAMGVVSFSGDVSDGDTVTINDQTYEFDTDSSYSDVQVDVSGSASSTAAATALADAVNGNGSNTTVEAVAYNTTVLIQAVNRGTGGNAYAFSATGTNVSVDGSGTMYGGGKETSLPKTNCRLAVTVPSNTGSGIFDTLQIFRTINLGKGTSMAGAIYYMEKETTSSLDGTFYLGDTLDEALPFFTQYNPETDVAKAPPSGGALTRYQGITFISGGDGEDSTSLFHSSPEHLSGEYFTTYNEYEWESEYGEPLRIFKCGDSIFVFTTSGILHGYQASKGKPLILKPMHLKRGLLNAAGAHAVGNSVFFVSAQGLLMLNGSDGSLSQVTSTDRIMLGNWLSSLSSIQSGYDAYMNTSYFLNSSREEVLQVCHTTHTVSLLEGCPFQSLLAGPEIAVGGGASRAYFVMDGGRTVYPDADRSGSFNMSGLDAESVTLNGTASSFMTHNLQVVAGTYTSAMNGAKLYMTSGNSAGLGVTIESVDEQGLIAIVTDSYPPNWDGIAEGDTFSIAPIPLKLRGWRVQNPQNPQSFDRQLTTGMALKVREWTEGGGDHLATYYWRCGFYRNSATSPSGIMRIAQDDDLNPSEMWEHNALDGIDLEPYVEQISSDVDCELTDFLVHVTILDSRHSE